MFKLAWVRCVANFRANIVAGCFIWFCGATICLSYYNVPAFADFLNDFGKLKSRFGLFYSAVSTAIFGGLLPYLLIYCRKSIPRERKVSWLLFFLLFWAVKGVEVDLFYRFQDFLFGRSTDALVVFYKVLVDQFVYCVFWSAPTTAIVYGWKNADFAWKKVTVIRSLNELVSESAFLLLTTWILWIPAVSIIYSMPANLQIPMFNLTLCFFVIIISYLEPKNGGIDGTRTRDLRRDRPAL